MLDILNLEIVCLFQNTSQRVLSIMNFNYKQHVPVALFKFNIHVVI